MKTIHILVQGFKTVLGLSSPKETPQLIAVTQENFCQNMAITDYYCDESNLFI